MSGTPCAFPAPVDTDSPPGADSFSSQYRDIPALVLGASGFVGGWVARQLSESGASVLVVVRDAKAAAAVRARLGRAVRVTLADLSRPGSAAAAIDEAPPAVIFNLAGYGVDRAERDPGLMQSLNADLVSELCRRMASEPDRGWPGLRLVHAGSALEYGQLDGPIDSSVTPRPTTIYGQTKLAGTEHVARHGAGGLRAVTARLFNVYGPGEHEGRLLPTLLQAASARTPVHLTAGTQRRDFTYVEDVAEGLLRLGVSPVRPGEAVNLATGRLTSVRLFAETAAEVLGIDPSRLEFGAVAMGAGEVVHGAVDVARVRALTGWVPATTVADGVRRALEFEHVH